ncbi:MAG: protein phosphatase 2C domain-containing protein [Pseudomonadota bacterium]
MTNSPDIRFDVASVLNRGCRDYQEDAIATDFPVGADFGYAVLSDGMGGHAAGDVASKIVVTEVFSELKFQSSNVEDFSSNVVDVLQSAAISANACMAAHTSSNPDTAGMGATLIAPVFVKDRLFWISIGDSPLYLYRDGVLTQLNEDHSLGPHIDYMVRSGMMSEDVGRNHPDRNALTSVLIGEAIERIDCPAKPVRVLDDDIFVVASDGLQFLTNREIRSVLDAHKDDDAGKIADTLLKKLIKLNDPEQDNISFSIIKAAVRTANGTAHPSEFGRQEKPRQVTTRPLMTQPAEPHHDEIAPVSARTSVEDMPPPSPAPAAKREGEPIFLRRRWLASDGSGA